MAITDFLFPQGNFLNIRSNAPNQRSYNIDATADLVRNNPLSVLGEIYAPALTAATSIPYDTIQGIGRAVDQSNIGTGPYIGIVDDTEIPRGPSLSDIGRAIDAENPLSSAIERTIGAATPLAERISNISNPFKMSQAAASEVDLSNRNINTTEPYQDKIMGGLEGDPLTNISNQFARSGPGIDQGFINQYNLEQRNDPMFDNEEYKEIPGFNYKDAPIETSFFKRMADPAFKPYMNNPATGFFDEMRSMGNPDASLVNRTKDKLGQGFNIGKQGLLTALGFATKAPLGLLSLVGKMLPERDYRQNVVEDFYSDPNTRGLMSKIPGMENYNTVSGGLLNALTGGKMGEETTFGLSGAIDKRMERINKTLKKKKSAVLEQRLKDLQALKDREAKALADARAKQSANLESQRRGRRPGSGGDGPGTKDSGGPTGGYSYDSGGRKGFGYGL